jgi:hypothetical protein
MSKLEKEENTDGFYNFDKWNIEELKKNLFTSP